MVLANLCWIIQIIQSLKLPLIMNSSGSVTQAGNHFDPQAYLSPW